MTPYVNVAHRVLIEYLVELPIAADSSSSIICGCARLIAMYWPIGTPHVYATSSQSSGFKLFHSHDGLTSSSDTQLPRQDDDDLPPPPTPLTPITPATPATPAIRSVDDADYYPEVEDEEEPRASLSGSIPTRDPILALRVSRSGQLFAVITATSFTIWQTKVGSCSLLSPALFSNPRSLPSFSLLSSAPIPQFSSMARMSTSSSDPTRQSWLSVPRKDISSPTL